MNRALIKATRLANRFSAMRALVSPGVRGDLARAVVEGKRERPIFAKAEHHGESVGELYIYEGIGFDCFAEGGGVTAQKVQAALDEMKGVKTLNIFINSPGGDVFEAKTIVAQLERFKAEKVVHVDGLAASAATMVAMAGDRIVTNRIATWMIHDAWSGAMGNAADMRAYADVLDRESQTLAGMYARQTGETPEAMRELMLAETWMTADEALAHGFTDEILEEQAEDDDEPEERAAASVRSPMVAATALTQNRINGGMSLAQQMSARAAARTTIAPGQPGEKRPTGQPA